MAKILRFPRHKAYRCRPTCGGCIVCDGGLFSCVTCFGAEASLPTDCPQYRCTPETLDQVQAGRIDFRRKEGWILVGGSNAGRKGR